MTTELAADRTLVRRTLAWLAGPVPVSIIVALAIGAVAIAIAGINPFVAYPSMVEGALTGRGPANTLQRATPIIGMAIALAIAFRAGVFNLGAEGQMVLGGLAGTLVALTMPGPGPVVIVVACLAAMAAGALWAMLAAVLQTSMGVPILISSLLLNYPARYFSSYLVRFPLKEKGSSMVATPMIPDDTRIPALIPADSAWGTALRHSLGKENALLLITRNVNYSLLVVLAVVALVIFVNRKTPGGFESGLAGQNLRFAQYGGVHTTALVIRTMIFSGAISGLVGVMLVLGSDFRLIDGALVGTNYAWTGLLVALLAANRPIGVLVSGAFFAALIVGGEAMQRSDGVSSQLSQVIQAAVIILIVVRLTLPRWLNLSRRHGRDLPAITDRVTADDEVGRV
ncbi:MAG: ABC transporter permease [Actinobacteria bacterium]|nr:ABC transporter permease [Actinomycetota bacterium]